MKMLMQSVALIGAAMVGLVPNVQAAKATQFPEVQGNAAAAQFVPKSIDTRPTKVVVLLAGDPVSLVQRNVGRPLSRAERDSVISQRRADHAAAIPEIQRRGGEVLGSFHSAMNGIKVSIAHSRLDSLRAIPGVVGITAVGIYKPNNSVSRRGGP